VITTSRILTRHISYYATFDSWILLCVWLTFESYSATSAEFPIYWIYTNITRHKLLLRRRTSYILTFFFLLSDATSRESPYFRCTLNGVLEYVCSSNWCSPKVTGFPEQKITNITMIGNTRAYLGIYNLRRYKSSKSIVWDEILILRETKAYLGATSEGGSTWHIRASGVIRLHWCNQPEP
jgi:hypothetical protein